MILLLLLHDCSNVIWLLCHVFVLMLFSFIFTFIFLLSISFGTHCLCAPECMVHHFFITLAPCSLHLMLHEHRQSRRKKKKLKRQFNICCNIIFLRFLLHSDACCFLFMFIWLGEIHYRFQMRFLVFFICFHFSFEVLPFKIPLPLLSTLPTTFLPPTSRILYFKKQTVSIWIPKVCAFFCAEMLRKRRRKIGKSKRTSLFETVSAFALFNYPPAQRLSRVISHLLFLFLFLFSKNPRLLVLICIDFNLIKLDLVMSFAAALLKV